MGECDSMRESMPLLLTESLDAASRERTHLHIEGCDVCSEEWNAYRETWRLLDELGEVEVPARVKQQFLARIDPSQAADTTPVRNNVVPFHRRSAARWLTQAAAVAIVAGGAFYAGHALQRQPMPAQAFNTPARVESIQPAKYSLAETRVLGSDALSPNIEGRPNIDNVQITDADPSDGKVGLAFDVTSHVTVSGNPNDKSMVRLLSYILERQDHIAPSRSQAVGWMRQLYANQNADPEIATALAKVLRSEEHEGVRIQAIDTLKTLPSKVTSSTRDALIDALKSDPNPAVRLKAIEALARMASNGEPLDQEAVDTLRKKAVEEAENLYVRVKAAEALSKIRP